MKGEWGIDNYGRLALAFPDNKGYRPSAADQQAFMQRLGAGAWQIFGAHGMKKDYQVQAG